MDSNRFHSGVMHMSLRRETHIMNCTSLHYFCFSACHVSTYITLVLIMFSAYYWMLARTSCQTHLHNWPQSSRSALCAYGSRTRPAAVWWPLHRRTRRTCSPHSTLSERTSTGISPPRQANSKHSTQKAQRHQITTWDWARVKQEHLSITSLRRTAN